MACYQSASATVRSGTTGFILIVKVKVDEGFVPATLKKGTSPFNPKNVFPVTVIRSVPSGSAEVELEITQNLSTKDEFDEVEIFCDDIKPGTRIPITKHSL